MLPTCKLRSTRTKTRKQARKLARDQVRIRVSQTVSGCDVQSDSFEKGYQYSSRRREPNKWHWVLGELPQNIRHYNKAWQSVYRCLACDVALCRGGPFFDRYHEQNTIEKHQ